MAGLVDGRGLPRRHGPRAARRRSRCRGAWRAPTAMAASPGLPCSPAPPSRRRACSTWRSRPAATPTRARRARRSRRSARRLTAARASAGGARGRARRDRPAVPRDGPRGHRASASRRATSRRRGQLAGAPLSASEPQRGPVAALAALALAQAERALRKAAATSSASSRKQAACDQMRGRLRHGALDQCRSSNRRAAGWRVRSAPPRPTRQRTRGADRTGAPRASTSARRALA